MTKPKAASDFEQMKVEQVPTAQVLPYAGNPRRNEAAVAKVAASLLEFGWRQPIVVDEAFVVIAGHTRLMAAISLGMETVPVHVAAGLSAVKARAYRLADNRTAEEADWDSVLLALEITALKADDYDLMLTGFNEHELEAILGEAFEEPGHDHWEGMPEFTKDDVSPFRSFLMHFKDQADVDAFTALVGQTITDKTKFLWYPKAEIGHVADKRYGSSEA